MMKKVLGLLCVVLLTGCSSLFEGIFSGSSGSSSGGAASGIGSPMSTPLADQANPNQRADPDAANWDIAALDTAKDADYLKGIEKDVVLEMNKVRSDPKKYAELYIKPTLQYYREKDYSEPGRITIVTHEGATAVNGCIAALGKTKPVGLLTPEKGLFLGARDLTSDQGKTGQTGHTGSDKSTPFTRIARYGTMGNTAGENLAYGPVTGREIVVQLLVDDGVPSRGHRTNIMNGAFTQTGVAFGTHPQFRTMVAITYANGYVTNP